MSNKLTVALAASAAVALALSLGASSVRANLVVGNDQTTDAKIYVFNPAAPTVRRVLVDDPAIARVTGLTVDDANQTIYWTTPTISGNTATRSLFKATYTPSGLLTPVRVGSTEAAGSAIIISGLAHVPGTQNGGLGRLIGYSSGNGFFDVDPTTGALSALFTSSTAPVVSSPTGTFSLSNNEFGGLDYDSVNGILYGVSDAATSNGGSTAGRGLYRLNNLLGASPTSFTATRVAAYNPSTDLDVDGLAVGGGLAYLVNDGSASGEAIQQYALPSSGYGSTIAYPWTNSTAVSSGGGWAPNLAIPEPASLAVGAVTAGLTLARRRAVR